MSYICPTCKKQEGMLETLRTDNASLRTREKKLREVLEHWDSELDREGLLTLVKEHRGKESVAAMQVQQFFEAREAALSPISEGSEKT